MDNGKVVAYRWKGSSVWQNGSGPKGEEAEHVKEYKVQIELAYSAAAVMELVEALDMFVRHYREGGRPYMHDCIIKAEPLISAYREKTDE